MLLWKIMYFLWEDNLFITVLSWGFSSLNIFATILNIKKIPISFLFWTICNIYWLAFDLFALHDYARVATDVINLVTSVLGFIVWSKSDKNRKRIKRSGE